MHKPLLAEAYLSFGRMDVGIHLLVGQLDKQQHHRVNSGRQNVAISFSERMLDLAVAHQASVDKDEDGIAVQLLYFWPRDETMDAHLAGFGRLVLLVPAPRR